MNYKKTFKNSCTNFKYLCMPIHDRFIINNTKYIFFRFYVRDGDDSLKDGCDAQCRREIICKIFTTVSLNSKMAGC